MDITLAFQLQQRTLPTLDEHLGKLWQVASVLEQFGFPIGDWCAPAATKKKSLETPAFDRNGLTCVGREEFRVEDEKDPTVEFDFRTAAVWCGKTKGREGAFSIVLSSDALLPTCLVHVQLDGVEALNDARKLQRLVRGLLAIWPAASYVEVGPLMYYTTQQVFPKRPGAGWMLYLAEIITAGQVPEAAELVPIMDGGTQSGTIIVSVADEIFSIGNAEHVKVANAVEVRLADLDLLPR